MESPPDRRSILVVDDDLQIQRLLQSCLDAHGFRTVAARTGAEALRALSGGAFDAVVLDVGLGDEDGIAVLARFREWTDVPALVLSARASEAEKVRALDAGADDYVTKPFGAAELLARMRVLLRRRRGVEEAPAVYERDGLRIDLPRRQVFRGGEPISLSRKEYAVLEHLARHPGRVVTHQQLLTAIWGPANAEDVQYLRIFIRKLRSRLEPDPARPRFLLTELGVGYRLCAPEPAPSA